MHRLILGMAERYKSSWCHNFLFFHFEFSSEFPAKTTIVFPANFSINITIQNHTFPLTSQYKITPFHYHHNTKSHFSIIITIQNHTFPLSSQYKITPFHYHHNTKSHFSIIITIQNHSFPLSSQYKITPFHYHHNTKSHLSIIITIQNHTLFSII